MTRRAARVDAYFTQRRMFLEWRQAAAKRRRQQWQVDMKKRLRTVRSMVDQRLLRQVWEVRIANQAVASGPNTIIIC